MQLGQQQDRLLYIGTDEQTAKCAPNYGVNPPVFLTDVYPTFFCPRDAERWGIVCVNLKYLDSPDPFPNSKIKWQKSLEMCGLCTFPGIIPACAVEKVIIYTPHGKHSNTLITELLLSQRDPRRLTAKEHKLSYEKNLCLIKWLSGEALSPEEFSPCFSDCKVLDTFRDKIHNKSSLEIYYTKTEDRKKRRT
jgi:hypothetical protein